ncbi:unnamed protein product, partial [Dovyalis caffra]
WDKRFLTRWDDFKDTESTLSPKKRLTAQLTSLVKGNANTLSGLHPAAHIDKLKLGKG